MSLADDLLRANEQYVETFDASSDLAFTDDTVPLEPEVLAEEATATEDDGEREVATATDASSRRTTGGDTGGAAAMIGYLGVLLAVVLAAADRLQMRRGKRRVIES